MAPQSNPPPALAPETSYRPRVPGGIEDRLDEVLGHEGNPYESNYEAMAEGLQSLRGRLRPKERSKRCGKCGGNGVLEIALERLAQRQKRLDQIDEDMRRTDSEDHRARLENDKRKALEQLSNEGWCIPCNGTGWIHGHEFEPLGDMWTTRRCEPCKGCGEVPDEDTQDYCPRCTDLGHIRSEGSGEKYYVALTARPKPSAAGGSGWSGSSSTDNPLDALPAVVARHSYMAPEAAVEYGRVQRAINEVRAENAVLAAAIESYHGTAADRWKLHPWGRRFALWVHTEAGAKLVRGSELGTSARFLEIDVIASERQAEEAAVTPNVRRRALIRDADRQARMLEALMQDRIRRIEL